MMHDFIYLILTLFRRGMHLVGPAMAACGLILLAVWAVCRARKRPVPWKKMAALLLLTGWAAMTLFVTLLRGEGNFYREWNLHLFLAWREAWNQFSLQVWLNVLLNIALFVPLGVLLPLLWKKCQRWYGMLAAGFGTSLAIELAQLASCRGMWDVDDLFTNTLGAMLGWGCTMAVVTLLHRGEARRGRRALPYLAIPAAFALAMAGLFGGYALQPYGNLPEAAVTTADLKNVRWTLDFTPADTPDTAPVYKVGRLDKAGAAALAAEVRSAGFPDTYYYDDLTIFADHSRGDFLHVHHRDGTWEYSYGKEAPVCSGTAQTPDRAELLKCLKALGITLPPEVDFATRPFGEGGEQVTFTANLLPVGDRLLHGTLTCVLEHREDGTTRLTQVENHMVTLELCATEPIRTPAQAVEELRRGRSSAGAVLACDLERAGTDQVEILSCTLDWTTDTKGFYQPVYRLRLGIGAEGRMTDLVPALG